MEQVYFITGIDTGCGKTITTGLMAKYLLLKNINVITQKLAQTGSHEPAEDIMTHRTMMKQYPVPEDKDGTTCPYVLMYPASPHLSAELECRHIAPGQIDNCTRILSGKYDTVLLEGAGGLMVPINREMTTLEFLKSRKYPLVLVTSSKLGSINHTLLTLEVCKAHHIAVKALVYNHYPGNDERITQDSKQLFQDVLPGYFPQCAFIEIPVLTPGSELIIDFSEAFRVSNVF